MIEQMKAVCQKGESARVNVVPVRGTGYFARLVAVDPVGIAVVADGLDEGRARFMPWCSIDRIIDVSEPVAPSQAEPLGHRYRSAPV